MKKLWEMKNKKKNNKGFSLVELIVVIAIMAVLIAVLAPALLKYVENSRKSTDATVVSGIVSTVQAAIISDNVGNGTYSVTIDDSSCTVSGDTDDGKLAAALGEAYNDYENELMLKANSWKDGGIIITFTVEDAKTSIGYSVQDFAEYTGGTYLAPSAAPTT